MKTGTNPYTPDPNRSTAVNFVHVNDRLLYIVDWRMVVVKGGMSWSYIHVKREEELSGRGNVRGICPWVKCWDPAWWVVGLCPADSRRD